MRQRGYAILFLLVLLISCAGALLGGRFLWQRLQTDFQPRQVWQPPTVIADATSAHVSPAPQPVESPTPPPQATPSVPTPGVIAASTAEPRPPTEMPRPTSTPPSDIALPTATPTDTATAEVGEAAPYQFALARPVRHSSGDCPGNYILGQVVDAAGNPLPDVRLWLVDEYGNEETKVSKSAAGEQGRYDFPLFGPPRHFYLAVVDGSGHPISPRVEIAHGLGPDANASCHWADWQRQ